MAKRLSQKRRIDGETRDAFSVLLGSGEKRRKVKDSKLGKTRPTQQKKKQRKYGECPICSASIPLAFLQRHVDSAHFSSNSSADQTLLETNDSSEDASGPSTGKSVCSLVSTNKGQNAFSTLMENAKKKPRSEAFCLCVTNGTSSNICSFDNSRCTWLDKNNEAYKNLQSQKLIKFQASKLNFKDPSLENTKNGLFDLATNMESSKTFLPIYKCNRKISISVVKSALQKNVRRCRPEQAVRCALHLINLSFTDFIRRVPIIILEDSILHPSFHILVWFMVADSKGFVINETHVRFFLQVVWEISSCKCRDPLPHEERSAEWKSAVNTFGTMRCESLKSDYHKTLVRAILCRARFGGMGGDVLMLKQYAYMWYLRFLHDQTRDGVVENGSHAVPISAHAFLPQQNGHEGQNIEWESLLCHLHPPQTSRSFLAVNKDLWKLRLRKVDIPPAGVDFHCVPKMVTEASLHYRDKMQKTTLFQDNNLEHTLKCCIWNFSSSVNHKCCLFTGKTTASGSKDERLRLLSVYKVCQKFILDYQQRYLAARF